MSVPLSDTRLAEIPFGVVLDRPDSDRVYAWGPFASFDAAAKFAEFVQAEIDPARVIPWDQATALPGVRVLDAVAELLTWRTTVALPVAAQPEDGLVRCRRPHCPNAERFTFAADRGWAHLVPNTWLCPEHAALAAAPSS